MQHASRALLRRASAVATALVGGALLGPLLAGACSAPQTVDGTQAPSAHARTAPPGSSVSSLESSAGDRTLETGDSLGASVEPPARAAQRCASPTASIVPPPAGTVFNNAQTSADAGFRDRTQAILDAIAAETPRYRCCFDALRAEPGAQHQLMLVASLDPEGHVLAASIDAKRSTVSDELVRACAVDVLETTSYPPSPSGAPSIVEYPLRSSWPR